jgi:hypothetical protein
MPENHDERAKFNEQGLNEQGFDEEDDFDAEDDLDDDDGYEPGEAGHAWPAPGYPRAGFPPPPGRHATRRGWVFALTAVVAAAATFGVVDVALDEASGSPAASAAPSASAPAGDGSSGGPPSGTQFAPGGGAPLPSGAAEHLLIGGTVTAVSATSITLGSGGQSVTAAVNHATKITGKVTRISGIKVGDLVSASLSGTSGGKLAADSIQDPASLPSGLGQ